MKFKFNKVEEGINSREHCTMYRSANDNFNSIHIYGLFAQQKIYLNFCMQCRLLITNLFLIKIRQDVYIYELYWYFFF